MIVKKKMNKKRYTMGSSQQQNIHHNYGLSPNIPPFSSYSYLVFPYFFSFLYLSHPHINSPHSSCVFYIQFYVFSVIALLSLTYLLAGSFEFHSFGFHSGHFILNLKPPLMIALITCSSFDQKTL